MEYEEHEPNDVIIQKGSSATHLFFLESGQVSIQDTTEDQRTFTLAIINPGNSFGEMALLDKQKRSANVVAQTGVSCYFIYDCVIVFLWPVGDVVITELVILSVRKKTENSAGEGNLLVGYVEDKPMGSAFRFLGLQDFFDLVE